MSGKDNRRYLAIDLKSFYASVECVERGLDPLTTNLVVADPTRTEKTICLAVSPSLKKFGIPGRPRLFEVVQKVRELNAQRKRRGEEPITYITAPPRMALYLEYSTRIYNVYLKYMSPEDMHVYSIDEVFFDATPYTGIYHLSPHDLAMRIIQDVLKTTGITATAGIGTNLYLCKIAMDIVAKHMPADKDGVRIAELDELSYRKLLWEHKPLTDFWRVGRGYTKKLAAQGLYTMGDIALCSLGKPNQYYNEELLFKLFGINAELLIDHAWGYEPCTMQEIKSYRPSTNSLSSGQVLQTPYDYSKAKLVTREMTEQLGFDLMRKHLATKQLVLTVGYDIENLDTPSKRAAYKGQVTMDSFGRLIPKHAHGTENLKQYTNSTKELVDAVTRLYERIMNPALLVRRITIAATHVLPEEKACTIEVPEQLDLFASVEETTKKTVLDKKKDKKAMDAQAAILALKERYGNNAVLKAADLLEGATAKSRNGQIGGHKA